MKITTLKKEKLNNGHEIHLYTYNFKVNRKNLVIKLYEVFENNMNGVSFTTLDLKLATDNYEAVVAAAIESQKIQESIPSTTNQEWNEKVKKLHTFMKDSNGDGYSSRVHLDSLCMLLVDAHYEEATIDKQILLSIKKELWKNGY